MHGLSAARGHVADRQITIRLDLLQVLRDKYGENVHVMTFGKPVLPWWSQVRNRVSWGAPGALGAGLSASAIAQAAVDSAIDTVHVRSLWAKYDL